MTHRLLGKLKDLACVERLFAELDEAKALGTPAAEIVAELEHADCRSVRTSSRWQRAQIRYGAAHNLVAAYHHPVTLLTLPRTGRGRNRVYDRERQARKSSRTPLCTVRTAMARP